MSLKIKLGIIAVVLLAVAGVFMISKDSPANTPVVIPNVVAKVNETELYKEDYDKLAAQISAVYTNNMELNEEQRKAVVDQLINEELLLQEAANKGITVTQEDVDAQLATLKGNFETEEAYQEALTADNLTEEELKENLQTQLTIQKYIDMLSTERNIEVTEEEIVASFEESTSGMENGPTLEEVREQITEQVRQEKVNAMVQEILPTLRANANVEVFI